MAIKFQFEREVSDEFMQCIFNTILNANAIDYWSGPDMGGGTNGFVDWNDESIVAIYIIEDEVVQGQTEVRKFKIDGALLHLGIERLINGETFAPADELGLLLHAMHEDEADEIDGEIVDRIVQAGLYNDIIFG
jgi:hypothetical protein